MFLTHWLNKLTAQSAAHARPAGFRPKFEALDDRITPHASAFLFDGAPPHSAAWSKAADTASTTAATPQVATQFRVLVRADAFAGGETAVTVLALDARGRVVPTYAGTVTLTSSDAGATLPAAVTFAASDRGVKAVSLTLATVGSQTVTATDAAAPPLTGSTTVTVRAASTTATGFGDGVHFGGFRHRGRRG